MIWTRRFKARWGLLGAVLLFAASLWIGVDRLNRQEEIIHSGRTSGSWMAVQLEVEYLRFMKALDRLRLADADVDHGELMLRFDILWSRIPIVLAGREGEVVRRIPGAEEGVTELGKTLQAVEPKLAGLRPGEPGSYGEIKASLDPYASRLHEITVEALNRARPRYLEEQVRAINLQVYLSAAGVLLTGALLIGLLFAEAWRSRRSQEAHERSERRLRGFLEFASDWTLELDENLRLKSPEESVRRRMLETTGLDIARAAGRTRWELAGVDDPESDETWRAHYADLMARREFRDFRYSFPDSSGRTHHLRVSGRPQFDEAGDFTGYISVGTDETVQMEARLRAEQAEAGLRDAINNVSGPLLILDADDRITFLNKRWKEWYPDLAHVIVPGMRFEELVRHITESGLWDRIGKRDEALAERLKYHREAPASFEREHSDGRFVLVNESRTQGGGWIIVHTDITELKQLDRLKDEFISMTSHELRTPLTSIKGALDLITAGVTEDAELETDRLLEIAKRNADRLLRIVNDILDSQKIESGTMDYRPQTVDLMPLLEKVIAANELFAQAQGVELRFNGNLNGAKIAVDVQRFDQLMTNLLSNAAKFAPRDSRISVDVQRRDDRIRISVHDEGPGIPSEFRDRVFERFWQADTSNSRGVQGTGLGLSISKKIAEAMGAEIGFDSEKGRGCTFFIDVPEAAAPRH